MNKQLLLTLIEQLDQFCGSHPESSQNMSSFLGFLHQQGLSSAVLSRNVAGEQEAQMIADGKNLPNEIARHFIYMSRYAKSYIKRCLQDSPLQTPEEFSFLIVLMTYDSLTKTELMTKNMVEKTSGTEIIRRLLIKGFLEQYDDKQDKRSKRIRITEKGRGTVFLLLPKMKQVGEIIKGRLSIQEQQSLLYLLQKLDAFHHELYTEHKDTPWDKFYILGSAMNNEEGA